MALYQETGTIPRHNEIFPGVSDWRMDMAPDNHAPPLSPDATQFLVGLTRQANSNFDAMAHAMQPGESNAYFTIHSAHHETVRLTNETIQAVYLVTKDIPTAHLVFFPAGAIPLALELRKIGYPGYRMHALDISGSKGTKSGSSSIKGAIPRELLNPTYQIVIPEDVMDTIDTMFTFVAARSIFRDPSTRNVEWFRALGERMKAAHGTGNDGVAAYDDFADAALNEHVSLLPIWSKNEQVRKAVTARARFQRDSIQQKLLYRYPITPLPPDLWALGGNYAMDTGVLWSRMREQLPDRLKNDPAVMQFIGPDGEWLVRAVRIGPLAYFENENQEENVIRLFADRAAQMLR